MKLRSVLVRLALPVICVLHVLLTLRFEPLSVVLGPDPIAVIDYDTHYQQTTRALEAYRLAGRTWGYDPHLLAGQISGVIFDADTKLHEMFVIMLAQFGVAPARGYNLFILIAHLLLPVTIYAAARLFRLTHAQSTLAVLLASMVWFFDSFSHWVFWVGMISYGFAAYACTLLVALFHRYCEDRRPWQLGASAVLLALLLHLHPYSFFILAIPMTLSFVRVFRSMRATERASVFGVALFAIAANVWWLRPSLKFWHYVLNSAFYLDAGASYLAFDYFGLLKEPSSTGAIAVRTAFRFLTLGAAAIGLYELRRDADRRAQVLTVGVGVLLGAAYFGGYIPPVRQVQPYRFILPGIFLATFPAAIYLVKVPSTVRRLWGGDGAVKQAALLLALTAFVAAPRLVRDMLYFLPEFLPTSEIPLPGAPKLNLGGGMNFGSLQWPEPVKFHHAGVTADERAITDFVRANDDGSGRWLVEWWMLGERFAWATNAQVLGGFRELNMQHSDANWFRRHEDGASADPAEFVRYLEQYNVKWVVMSTPMPAIESRRDVLIPEKKVAGARIYRTKLPSSFIEGNLPGTVEASLDRISVRGSNGGDMVLRYHFLETLQCRPNCTIYRAEIAGDRVGFIGVRGAPSDFEIVNAP